MSRTKNIMEDKKIQEDKKRVEDFMKDYKALVGKHQIDFANYPVYVPTPTGDFKTVIQTTPVDLTKLAKPSPFMDK